MADGDDRTVARAVRMRVAHAARAAADRADDDAAYMQDTAEQPAAEVLAPLPSDPASTLTPAQQERVRSVCDWMRAGQSQRQACISEGISRGMIQAIIASDPWAQREYTSAREAMEDYWADEIIGIADDTSDDVVRTEDGGATPNHAAVARARLRVSTRQWLMSRRAPLKYGDRLQVAGDAASPLTVVVRRMDADATAPGDPGAADGAGADDA